MISNITMQFSNICHWTTKNMLYEMWEQYTLSSSKSHDHIYCTISQHNDTMLDYTNSLRFYSQYILSIIRQTKN